MNVKSYKSYLQNIILVFLSFILYPSALKLQAQTPIYMDSTASVADRVNDLMGRMTLIEKVGQITQIDLSRIGDPENVKSYCLGSLLSGGDSDPADITAKGWADTYNKFQQKALETRLKIPIIYGIDAVHGHNNVLDAVIFPHNIGMGCTRDTELVKEAARITAIEVVATGIDWTFSPCIAVVRDERWGRTYEGFGETPELARMMAPAAVRGYQGNSLSNPTSILACAKHYVGDGGTTGGVDQGNTEISESELRAIHLPGYIAAINSGVGSVMVSFSSWNGVKMHSNKYLVTDVLKTELGFKGIVVSDWAAVNQLSGTYEDKVEAAINAGIDMVMVPDDYAAFTGTLKGLVDQGKVSVDRIDDAVKRILTKKFEMRLFERPFADSTLLKTVGSEEHREVARQCVRESLVLLKKKDGILPLNKNGQRILVAGINADNIGNQCGGWTISWQGRSGNVTSGTTILRGIKKAVGSTIIDYSADGNFDNTDADFSVAVVGETPYAEGRGDRIDLTLSKDDITLVKKMKSYGKPVIVIIISGRPLIIEPILHYADVIIAAWLPGTEGEGISDVLFGDYQPAGILSHTWPKSMEQIPINSGDANYDPLFEYGFGIKSLSDSPYGSKPVLLSSIVTENGRQIELTFNKPMDSLSLLNSEFEILKNNVPMSVGINPAIKINDKTTIVLNITETFSKFDEVMIKYVSGSIASEDKGELEPTGFIKVINEVKFPPVLLPCKIEAEDYNDMFGVTREITTDIDGSVELAGIDNGDWMEYSIDVPKTDYYKMGLRISALSNTGKVTVSSNKSILFSRNLPATGSLLNWTTVYQVIGLKSGIQNLLINADIGGFKLNWISFQSLTSVDENTNLPKQFDLCRNYPNPFNPVTVISYQLPEYSQVELRIYNILGNEVAVLVNEKKSAGTYNVSFNAMNLSSGVYICRMKAVSLKDGKDYTKALKLILLK